MNLDEVIKKLTDLRIQHGNLEVMLWDSLIFWHHNIRTIEVCRLKNDDSIIIEISK